MDEVFPVDSSLVQPPQGCVLEEAAFKLSGVVLFQAEIQDLISFLILNLYPTHLLSLPFAEILEIDLSRAVFIKVRDEFIIGKRQDPVLSLSLINFGQFSG